MECFVTHFSLVPLIALAGIASSFKYTAAEIGTVLWCADLLDWAFALAMLAYVNWLVYLLDMADSILEDWEFQMGKWIMTQLQQQQVHSGVGFSFIRPSAIGCVCVWSQKEQGQSL